MWYQALSTVLLLGALNHLWKIRVFLDWDKPFLYDHAPGPCVEVLKDGGSEDLTHIDDGNPGTILFSHGIGWDEPGKIMIMDVYGSPIKYRALNISNPPSTPEFMIGPHGISTWKDPKTGQITVFVITHPPNGDDRVEVFELVKSTYLKHIRSITDRKFRSMNDLVAVAKDKFYITKFSHFHGWQGWYLEIALLYGTGEVLFYDGKKFRTVASGFMCGNGINISPDKSMVYVADFGGKQLVGFKRQANNDLTRLWEEPMNTAVDNIEVDPETGDLWIGCHPVMYNIAERLRAPGIELPSNVLKVKIKDGMVEETIEVYADNDGSDVFGASAATLVGDKLVIGTVWNNLVVCDVKHIE